MQSSEYDPPLFPEKAKEPSQKRPTKHDEGTLLCECETRTSALILTGGLQAVLPGRTAIPGDVSTQCAVCKFCKGFICRVLR